MFKPGDRVTVKWPDDVSDGLTGVVIRLRPTGSYAIRFAGATWGHDGIEAYRRDNSEHWFVRPENLELAPELDPFNARVQAYCNRELGR